MQLKAEKKIVSYLAELCNEAHCHEDCFWLKTEHVCRVANSPVTTERTYQTLERTVNM